MSTGVRTSSAAEQFKEAAFISRKAAHGLAAARTAWEDGHGRGHDDDEMRALDVQLEVCEVRRAAARKLEADAWGAYLLDVEHG